MASLTTVTARDTPFSMNVSEGLVLYLHRYSYYSQKVLLALFEKRLPFQTEIIEIVNGQQYEPWFLKLNPRGEVPVLQDGDRIISDSVKIIDYLEDTYNSADTPRLVPMGTVNDPKIRQSVTQFRRLLDQIPSYALTIGSFLHPEVTLNTKAPFYSPVRKMLLDAEKSSSANLRKHAELNPASRDILLRKADNADKNKNIMQNKDEFSKLLKQMEDVMNQVENKLVKNEDVKYQWLCCNDFTAADISLAIMLHRLDSLGLSHIYWSAENRPRIFEYFRKVQQRDSYVRTIPTFTYHFKTVVSKTPTPILIGVGVMFIAVIGVLGFAISKAVG